MESLFLPWFSAHPERLECVAPNFAPVIDTPTPSMVSRIQFPIVTVVYNTC